MSVPKTVDVQVPALERALDIVERIAFTSEGISYSELRQTTGIPPASLTRILALLAKRGYLDRAPNGNYTLGLRLYAVGSIAGQQMDLLKISAPILGKLRDDMQETVELGVVDGLEIVIVAKIESTHSVRLFAQVGYRFSRLHASGLGKTMLAYMGRLQLDAYIAQADWTPVTKNTVTDLRKLRRDLERIRQRGYGYDNGEIREEVRRFAAPVFDATGKLAAALSLAGPSFRMPLEKCKDFGFAVKNAAAEISTQLGYRAF